MSNSPVLREFAFCVLGSPIPKARARKGCSGVWYTPQSTVRYEGAVRMVAACARPASWSLTGRYSVTVHCYFGDARHRDLDNVLKSVCDALNGVAWADDSQVDVVSAQRQIDRDNTRTAVTISRLDGGA